MDDVIDMPKADDGMAGQPALSEAQTLKAQIWQLELANAQLQVNLAEANRQIMERDLNTERKALEHDFRSTLNPSVDAEWSWEAQRLVVPTK